MPEGKKPAEDLYSAKTHLHQPVPEVSTVNATALPADAPEGALPSEVRPEIVTWEKLCEAIKASGKAYNMEMITKAYDLANKAHNGVCRRSGEPYICHPLAVARLVLDLGMDSESIAAALLHDVVERCAVDDHVLDDGVCSRAERLDLQGIPIFELEQALLAGRGILTWAMRATIDLQATGTTDAFTAIGGEGIRLLAFLDQTVVDVIEQLQ